MSNKFFSEEFFILYNDFYKQVIKSSQFSSEQWQAAMKPYTTLAESFQFSSTIYKIGLEPLTALKDLLINQNAALRGINTTIDIYKSTLIQQSFASDAYKAMIRDLQKYVCESNNIKKTLDTSGAYNELTPSNNVALEDLTYTINESDQVECSLPLENIVEGIVETVYDDDSRPSKDKVHNSDFFLSVLLPLIIAVLALGFDIISDIQTNKQIEQHHQEEIAIQEQLLQEERQQTEYLKELSQDSSSQQLQK